MGVAIPGVTGLLHQPTGQVIDGSLKFDQSKSQHLTRTFGAGNRRTWTHSSWVRQGDFGRKKSFFMVGPASGLSNANYLSLDFDDNDKLRYAGGAENFKVTSARFRDTGWYHVVWSCDTTQAAAVDRTKIYVNGELITAWSTSSSNPTQNFELPYNENGVVHRIGTSTPYNNDREWNDAMSQVYFIDGQALGPGYFGFTDPLTNTWRPKKFRAKGTTVNDGTVWSSGTVTGTAANASGSGGWAQAFDGNVSNLVYPSDSNGSTKLVLPKPIPFVSNVRLYAGQNATSGTDILVNGINLSDSLSFPLAGGWLSIDHLITSPITSLELKNVGGQASNIRALEIDGVIVTNSTTTNLDFGTNGFYLPMDGNSPIGQDKSGNGNDWTPVNFGGSVALDNPKVSGARPILNTLPGGNVAVPGVFGSKENKYYTVTTANGSVYQFDITSGDNPSLSFIRGATYKFDYSSFTGHPVLFSSTNPDSSTTAYTDGTSIASNVISFTVPHNAPDTLYYYCQNHPTSMNGSISVITDETKADLYAWKNFLALPLVGSDNDVSDSVNCTSNAKTPTNSSVTASTTQSNFYGGSHHWNSNTDSLLYAQQGNDLVFGTGDFTIEFWFYDDNGHNGFNNRCVLFDNRRGGDVQGDPPQLVGYVDSHNEINLNYANGSEINITVPSTVGKWWHYAAVRSGGTTKLYIDGVEVGSGSDTTNYPNNGIALGSGTDSGYSWSGYIQDFRVYKTAKYTSNFTPASTNPDILPDTPSGVSGSSKLTISPDTNTEGAVVFDGNSDYLSSTGPGTLAASSNWCMECTFYCTGNSSGTYRIMGANESSESTEYLQMRIRLGQYQFYTENANTLTGTAAFNKWTHMALTKSGTTVRAFVDGKQLWSTTDNNADTITTLITGWGYGSEYFPGFISNARFVNGSSVYTSEFNPPVVPLTNITNTTHLFCQSNTSATAAAVGTITANGTAAASRFTPFNTDINTVRGQETGYATLNPLTSSKFQSKTLKDGNLEFSGTNAASSGYPTAFSNLTMNGVGKWYMEVYPFNTTDTNGLYFGICDYQMVNGGVTVANTYPGGPGGVAYAANGTIADNGSNTFTGQPTYTAGDVISVAYDADNGKVYFAKNGVYINGANPVEGTNPHGTGRTGDQFFVVGCYNNRNAKVNFGQKPFKFPPPDGFQPLNAANVRPETVISRPDQYVGIVTYTGDSTDNRQIRVGMQPDLVWTKRRDTALDHHMWDSVRGAAYELYSNQNYEQGGPASPLRFAGFNYDGFTVNNHSVINQTGNWVAWCWKAGGNKNTFNIDDVGYANASDVNMSVGTLNSSLYNQSQTWSSSLTISGSWDGGSSAANAFDGLLSTNARAMGQNMQITFDITSTPLTFTDKVELYTSSSGMDVSVNGGTAQVPATNQFVTIASGGGTLNTITFDNVNAKTVVTALRVDGKLLVDPNAITTPSIAATGCSVGTKQGFSIIKYTGTGTAGTIPHGLLEQPKFVVIKDLKNANAWAVQHVGTTLGTGLLKWGSSGNSAVDSSVASPVWNSTAPTSSVFSVGTSGDTNYTTNSAEYIAYLWHDVPGLQKFGSYTGNGSTTSGAFVQLDFKPALIWVKRRDSGSAYSSWAIYDSTRSKFNTTGTSAYNFPLWINRDAQEGKRGNGTDAASGAENIINLFSNGFMALGAGAELNVANEQYIYCAWAEVPTFNLYGGQANAR